MMKSDPYSSVTTLWLWCLSLFMAPMLDIHNPRSCGLAQSQISIGIPGVFEVNVSVPEEVQDIFDGSDDEEGGDDVPIDVNAIIDGLTDFIGEALDNFTLPPELEDLFSLPTFDNFEFSFGGNCTLCDDESAMEGNSLELDGIKCSDWAVVSALGILQDSDECDLLRVAAAQHCQCPVPEPNTNRVCYLCPEGESPKYDEGTFEDTLAVTCGDLINAPAVDGDKTCNLISKFAPQCQCEVKTSQETVAVVSGASLTSSSLLFGVFTAFLGVFCNTAINL